MPMIADARILIHNMKCTGEHSKSIWSNRTRRAELVWWWWIVVPLEIFFGQDTHTYDRRSLEQWMARCKAKGQELISPKANLPMAEGMMCNQMVRTMALDFMEAKKKEAMGRDGRGEDERLRKLGWWREREKRASRSYIEGGSWDIGRGGKR